MNQKLSIWVFVCVLFYGCQTGYRGHLAVQAPPSATEIHSSVVYVIHGDGSYLYHNAQGTAYQADETALGQAFQVAEGLPQAEVFIFHQKPKKHWLFLFRKKESVGYYYRGGQLISKQVYGRDPLQPEWAFETHFFNDHTVLQDGQIRQRVFLYYGHEIPIENKNGYHGSFSNKPFGVETFTDGIRQFCNLPFGSTPFDLLVLSVCNSGNPFLLSKLSNYARFVVASPETVHLSHIDSHQLLSLNADVSMAEFGNRFAQTAFEGLVQRALTTVTVVLYDMAQVKPFLNHDAPLGQSVSDDLANDRCLYHHLFNKEIAQKGVTVFYRPPWFGKHKYVKSHLGWGCVCANEILQIVK